MAWNNPMRPRKHDFESGASRRASDAPDVAPPAQNDASSTPEPDHAKPEEAYTLPQSVESVSKASHRLNPSEFPTTQTGDFDFSEEYVSDTKESVNENLGSGNSQALLNESGLDGGFVRDTDDKILSMLNHNQRILSRAFPDAGIRSSRIITANVMLAAPAGYFDQFSEIVRLGVQEVRAKMTEDTEGSDILGDAERNPTDDAYQDRAYFKIVKIIDAFLRVEGVRFTNAIRRQVIKSMIVNEILGFGVLDPFWRDPSITEIIVNGPHVVKVERKGQVLRVPSCHFNDANHLKALIDRLYSAINKVVSPAQPMVLGRLHDRSRIFAQDASVAPDGPNFNIRRHPRGYWEPAMFVENGAATEELMTFLGNSINAGASVIVTGGTHSGKTSLLNAMIGFIRDDSQISVLEKNIELKPNPRKMLAASAECRDPNPQLVHDKGVTMRDLVKGVLQQRPDVIVVGEVTDEAAYDLGQAVNTGHSGYATVHSNDSSKTVDRMASLMSQSGLVTKEGALETLSAAFDLIVAVKHYPQDGSRRIVSVAEVDTKVSYENGSPVLHTRELISFREQGVDENGKIYGDWEIISGMSEERKRLRRIDAYQPLSWKQLKELSSVPEGFPKVGDKHPDEIEGLK